MGVPNAVSRFLLPQNCMAFGQISAANTNRDGTGTIVDVLVAGSEGTEIESVRVQAVATTTVGVVRLFIHNGTVWRLWKELLVDAITPSASVEAFSVEDVPTTRMLLPFGYKLGAATHNAETFNVWASGGNY